MKMVAQGYPLFAVTVNADGEDPRLGWVVGWSVQSGHEAWPVVAMPGGMAYVKRPSFLRYIGPDREAAQKAINDAVSATLSPERCGESAEAPLPSWPSPAPRLVLTPWQMDILSITFSVDRSEVEQLLAPILPSRTDPYAPCECTAIPWKPHRHRLTPRVESAPRGESRSDQPGETPLSRG